MAILTMATAGGIWTKFDMEVLHTPQEIYRLCGYVVGEGVAVGGRGNIDLDNRWRDLDQIGSLKGHGILQSGVISIRVGRIVCQGKKIIDE